MQTILEWISSLGKVITPLFAILVISLSACGVSEDMTGGDSGEVLVSLTDAEGDFINYEVDVTSIKLTRKDGTQIEVLPQTARIDFAQYVDLEELVTTATIPSGIYTHASLALNYLNANIQVEVAGLPTPAIARDTDGNTITTLEMKVKLDDQRHLLIAPGVPSHLTLDFDLDVSNRVDTTALPPVVRVEPVLIADVNLEKPKIRRARGPLLSINEDEQSFQIALRPFHHRIDHRANGESHFGKLDVVIEPETVFEVDGITEKGPEGLRKLAQKSLFTPVIVFGQMNLKERLFRAREVVAGSSVPGGTRDALRGTVIARAGDRLTVRVSALNRGGGRVILNSNVTVLLGENTTVTKQGDHLDVANALGKDRLSIGQAITVFGSISGTISDGVVLDATEGHVRMRFTRVAGTLISRTPEEVLVNLQSINGRRIGLYDFTGTGSDPAAYRIVRGSMTLGDLEIGQPIRLRGHVTAFGQAPPDFEATTIIDVSGVCALMVIAWETPTATPFLNSDASALAIDIRGSERHHVIRAHLVTPLMAEPAPQVSPIADDGRYAIRQGHTTSIHHSFTNFVRDLKSRLSADATMARFHARGRYEDLTQTMSAKTVTVALK